MLNFIQMLNIVESTINFLFTDETDRDNWAAHYETHFENMDIEQLQEINIHNYIVSDLKKRGII